MTAAASVSPEWTPIIDVVGVNGLLEWVNMLMLPITQKAGKPDVASIMPLTVVQPVDAEGLPMAFCVAMKQELIAAKRALFVGLLDQVQHIFYGKLVVSSCVFGASFLPILDYILLQPCLD